MLRIVSIVSLTDPRTLNPVFKSPSSMNMAVLLNQEKPREYVLSSNEIHTVKEFIDLTCQYANLDVEWKIDNENPLNTILLCKEQIILKINEELYRPAEVELLYGDSTESRIAYNTRLSSRNFFTVATAFLSLARANDSNDRVIAKNQNNLL